MKDSHIINNLKELKKVKPDTKWQKDNRALLMNQISSGQGEGVLGSKFWQKLELPFIYMRSLPQPVLAVILIVLFFGGSSLSMYAARDAQPGQALYVAKKVGEKTQLAFTFDEEKKLKLGLEFANERVQELNQVLETQDENTEEKVVRLVEDFKKEISVAKERAEKIALERGQTAVKTPVPAGTGGEPGEDAGVFSAAIEKEDQGIETSAEVESLGEAELDDAEAGGDESEAGTPIKIDPEAEAATGTDAVATGTTAGQIDTAVVKVEVNGTTTPQEIIDQVEKDITDILNQESVNQEDLTRLEMAIDQVNVGQVKGASTSEEVIMEEVEEDGGEASSTELSY